ncbi:hypothetical protein ColTof4_11154 [Colletotrichum tofieldiae]|uniref:Uncharacterized protein n=1 Tax=Colletotrichum tofieldiae TaxID=708197 RepID=A0A166YEL1_9PEZI|nr:hypothetical protein CT0861_06876 [Colletotrichum tofieldiae]GKT78731.1 hypothetical protein ColTof4_11154 [Colletotrichum tofieldiae]
MPPKKNTTSEGEDSVPSFTQNEALFVKALFDSMNSRPDVDYDKVAATMGLANAKSARDKFRIISKKHGWSSTDGSGGGAASSPAKGALGAKNPAKVKKPPAKKKGTAQRKKKAKKEESPESDNDEDVSAKLESDSDGQKAAKDELTEDLSDSE